MIPVNVSGGALMVTVMSSPMFVPVREICTVVFELLATSIREQMEAISGLGRSSVAAIRAPSLAPCRMSRFWEKTHANSMMPNRSMINRGAMMANSTRLAPRSLL